MGVWMMGSELSNMPVIRVMVLCPQQWEYVFHQFLQYFTEEAVSIGLKKELRVGTSIP